MLPLHCPTPKILTLVQESGTYRLYNYKPSYSQFYGQIVNFSLPWRLPWRQRSVGANLNDTVKLADLENPQFGKLGHIS